MYLSVDVKHKILNLDFERYKILIKMYNWKEFFFINVVFKFENVYYLEINFCCKKINYFLKEKVIKSMVRLEYLQL